MTDVDRIRLDDALQRLRQLEMVSAQVRRSVETLIGRYSTQPTLEGIVVDVAKRRGLHLAALSGTCRLAELVAGRREIAVRARSAGYSTPRIARLLGKHHTTVLYWLETAEKGAVSR